MLHRTCARIPAWRLLTPLVLQVSQHSSSQQPASHVKFQRITSSTRAALHAAPRLTATVTLSLPLTAILLKFNYRSELISPAVTVHWSALPSIDSVQALSRSHQVCCSHASHHLFAAVRSSPQPASSALQRLRLQLSCSTGAHSRDKPHRQSLSTSARSARVRSLRASAGWRDQRHFGRSNFSLASPGKSRRATRLFTAFRARRPQQWFGRSQQRSRRR